MSPEFIPALRFPALTPWYDRVVAWSTRDAALKAQVVAAAQLRAGERVLDVGCGTGTLMVALGQAVPGIALTGFDADPAILELALAKAQAANVPARFVRGLSHSLPFPPAHFDLAVSTLFFHHLQPAEKRRALQELHRVLRPGARLVIADFGRARSRWRRTAFHLVRLLDGYPNTRDHAQGVLASYLLEAGFTAVQTLSPLPVPIGSVDILVALRTQ